MPLPRSSHRSAIAVTDRRATTSWPSVAPRAGRGKSWVLAMLAPKRGLRVAPVPPKTADLTRPARGRRDNGRSGRRNTCFDRTKEQSRTSWPCRHDRSSLTVRHPMVGETEHASHTEIRTLPLTSLRPGPLHKVEHRQSRYLNNQAENAHRPTRRRERQMQRFKSPEQAQGGSVANRRLRRPQCMISGGRFGGTTGDDRVQG